MDMMLHVGVACEPLARDMVPPPDGQVALL